jgi:hypothetical protein
MPYRITVEAKGASEATTWLRQVGDEVSPMLKALGFDSLRLVQAQAIRNLSGSYPGPNQEHVLAVRSGTLRRFTAAQPITVEQDGLSWGLPVGPNESRIGRFLNEGGTIRAKTSKMLRIPLPAALTSQGVDRNAGRSLRGDPNFFFWVSKAGTPILWKVDRAKSGKIRSTPWYVLKASVTIRGRHWFDDAVEKITQQEMAAPVEGRLAVLLRDRR